MKYIQEKNEKLFIFLTYIRISLLHDNHPLKMFIKSNFARFMKNGLDKHSATVSKIIFKRMSLHS